MAADRAEHVDRVIEPALAAGAWVVTDRYAASTIAYQGYGRGLDPAALSDLVRWASAGLAADLSVLVDVEVEVAATRPGLRRRAAVPADRLERLGPAFASRVRHGFLAQAAADPDRWLVVDGTEEVGALTARIVAARAGTPRRPAAGEAGDRRRATSAPAVGHPAAELFDGLVGQEDAVAALRAAAANPVHAYLFVGPIGHGGLVAAHSFAAALLCPRGWLRRVRHLPGRPGRHRPGSARRAPQGASVRMDEIRQAVALAQRRPLARGAPGDRRAATCTWPPCRHRRSSRRSRSHPATLCSSCWPTRSSPGSSRWPAAASRSPSRRCPRPTLVRWLTDSGVPPDTASVVADSSGGNPERARVMVDDPDVAARVALWTSVPTELHPPGTSAAAWPGGYSNRPTGPSSRCAKPTPADRAPDRGGQGDGRALPAGTQGTGRAAPTPRAPVPHRRPAGGARGPGPDVPGPGGRGAGRPPRGRGRSRRASSVAAVGLITETAEALPRNPNEGLLLAVALRPPGRAGRLSRMPRAQLGRMPAPPGPAHRTKVAGQSLASRRAQGREGGDGRHVGEGSGSAGGSGASRSRPASRSGSSARSKSPGTANPSTSAESRRGRWSPACSWIETWWSPPRRWPTRSGASRTATPVRSRCARRCRACASESGQPACPRTRS